MVNIVTTFFIVLVMITIITLEFLKQKKFTHLIKENVSITNAFNLTMKNFLPKGTGNRISYNTYFACA